MVTNIFGVIGDVVSNFVATLISAVNGLIPLLYDTSGTTPQFTFVGTMLLIAVGMGIVYWVFRLLRGLTSGLAR